MIHGQTQNWGNCFQFLHCSYLEHFTTQSQIKHRRHYGDCSKQQFTITLLLNGTVLNNATLSTLYLLPMYLNVSVLSTPLKIRACLPSMIFRDLNKGWRTPSSPTLFPTGFGNLTTAQRHSSVSARAHLQPDHVSPSLSSRQVYLRWPPAAAWVWARPWSPPRCSRSACRPSSGGSCTTPWTSAREQRERGQNGELFRALRHGVFSSSYHNKPLWIENKRKWNSMDGKGVEGAALIRGEAEEEKGRRGKNGYNTMLLYKRREQSDLSLN